MKPFKKILSEATLEKELPDDIKQSIMQNNTSLGNNPAIPDIFDVPYLYKAAEKQFNAAKEELIGLGEMDVDGETAEDALSNLIRKCKELERPIRNELEKMCYNYLIEYFSIPEDSVDIELSLVDEVDLDSEAIILDPNDTNFEFDDITQARETRSEVYKRRILDALCMGAGLHVSTSINESILEKIEKLNNELPLMYKQITALNNYVLFLKENLGMTDDNKMQLGTVEVSLGNEDEKVLITAQGVVFPILVCEAFRGFFELFISHGLPKDKELAMTVLGKSDFLKAEPWDMRIGPHIWNMFEKSLSDITSHELPYLIKNVASLEIGKFNFLMKEILAGTKKGRRIMASLCKKAKDEKDYNRFIDKMDKMKADKGIITDDYIHPEEL